MQVIINNLNSNYLEEISHELKNVLRNQKILITGSSGFLGYSLLHTLLKINRNFFLKLDITCISQGEMDYSFCEFKNDFKHVKGDLTNDDFIQLLDQYDTILHFAGYAQPSVFMANPISTFKINTDTVTKLISKCKPDGNFLFISSSEVYSNLKSEAPKEDEVGWIHPKHPRAPYVLSKLSGETICLYEAERSNKNIKIVRLSMVYGPGIKINDTRALSQFMHQAIFSNQIKLLDQGNASRGYLYIKDAIRAFFNIIWFGKKSIYNVGSGRIGTITIAELARNISSLANVKLEFPSSNENLLGANDTVNLDISRYENEFGLLMKTPFTIGINETYNWVCKNWKFQEKSRDNTI